MLASLIAVHRPQVASLAASWLRCGASSFSIWREGRRLEVWPAQAPVASADFSAPVVVGELTLGELQVCGALRPEMQERLAAEAALLGQWVHVEGEIDGVTNELIEAQDQLLALYDLSRSTRSHLSLPETLSSLAREAARLVKSEAAAAPAAVPGGSSTVVQHPPAWADDEWLLSVFRQTQAGGRELLLNRNGSNPARLPAGIDNIFMVPIQISGM